MNLYVWEEALQDYTPGIIFTLAPDLETAKAQVLAKCLDAFGEEIYEDYYKRRVLEDLEIPPKVYPLYTPITYVVPGVVE